MIPVDQTLVQGPGRIDGRAADGTPGDCVRAALASVLEVGLLEVPHVVLYLSWWDEARRAARSHGWDLVCIAPVFPVPWEGGPDVPEQQRFVLLAGVSPRGDFLHQVVVDHLTGELVHDPHPSRAGVLEPWADAFALVRPYDPPPAARLALGPAPYSSPVEVDNVRCGA